MSKPERRCVQADSFHRCVDSVSREQHIPIVPTYLLQIYSGSRKIAPSTIWITFLIKHLTPLVPYLPSVPQSSLWILRVAVGIVSNVDLPLNETLGAIVEATGAKLLNGFGTQVSTSVSANQRGGLPVFGADSTDGQQREFVKLRARAYEFLCDFMHNMESSPPQGCYGCLPFYSPPPTDESMVDWRDSMVQIRGRSGGWVWVLKKNEVAYLGERGGNAVAAPAPMS